MSVGTGSLGYVRDLRGFADWRLISQSEKRVIVEILPGQVISGWGVQSGNAYVSSISVPSLGGVNLVVVQVRASNDTRLLERAESLADCVANAGTFYYAIEQPVDNGRRWDDGLPFWDAAGALWDQAPSLTVHLWSDFTPNVCTVLAEVLLVFSTVGMPVPDLGPEKAPNGSFEGWAGGLPTLWTVAAASPATSVTQDVSSVGVSGESSVKIRSVGGTVRLWDDAAGNWWDAAGAAWDLVANPYAELTQVQKMRLGAIYAISGYYRTDEGSPTFVPYWRFGIPGASQFIQTDGVGIAGTYTALPATQGEWRFFYLEFRGWADSDAAELLLRGWNGGGGLAPSGNVWFDDVKFRRVWRWMFADPRISSEPPAVSTQSRDIYFGGKTVGSGNLEIINSDDHLNRLLHSLDWLNREVRVWMGGVFPDGQALLRQDFRQEFAGLIDTVDAEPGANVSLSVLDLRDGFSSDVPRDAYRGFPDVEEGESETNRPLLFGSKTAIRPMRISRDTAVGGASFGGYGVYEVCDPTDSPAGIRAVSAVYAFVDAGEAEVFDTSKGTLLVEGTDYTADLTLARINLLRDAKITILDASNNVIEWTDGTARAVGLGTGNSHFTPRTLCEHLQERMLTLSSGITVTYNEATNKVTIAKSSGTLSLIITGGTYPDKSVYPTIGFTGGANRSGFLSYDADDAMFADADDDHHIRVNATGYKDDASGTYTGTPGAAIKLGCDIVRYLVSIFLRRPEAIDPYSFVAARTLAPQSLAIFQRETLTLREVIDRIELTCGADCVVDGDGLFYFTVATDDVTASVVDLYERDFLSFKVGLAMRDIYPQVIVTFDRTPDGENLRGRTRDNIEVPTRYGRTETRWFETFLESDADCVVRADAIAAQASGAKRLADVEVKGKLSGARIGTKVRITHSRTVDSSGGLNANLFRVIAIEKQPADSRVSVTLVEV